MKQQKGFTLIELMVALLIFSIIAVISYRTLNSLVTTKEVVENAQTKLGQIAKAINRFSVAWNRAIPLVIRGEDGIVLPSVLGKQKLEGKYDAQLEITEAGFIGDQIYGSSPPKRIGFRFIGDKLYLITWPVLNRLQTTVPRVDLLLENIDQFKLSYYYLDRQWHDTWPVNYRNINMLPKGIKLYMKLNSGEEITRQWGRQ